MEFSGSRAISDAFAAIKQRAGPLIGLWAVFFAIQLALVFGFAALSGLSGLGGMATAPAMSGAMVIGVVLFYILNFFVGAARSAAMSSTASPISKSSFAAAFSLGFTRAPTLLALIVLLIVAYIGVVIVFSMVVGAIGAVAGSTVAAILALVVALPGLAYLGTRISLVTPVVAVDNVRNPVAAIGRSWRMTGGAALRIFLVYLGFGLVALLLLGLLLAPLIGAVASASIAGQVPDFAGLMGSFVFIVAGFVVLSIVFTIVFAALIAAIHSQLSPDAGERIGETFS